MGPPQEKGPAAPASAHGAEASSLNAQRADHTPASLDPASIEELKILAGLAWIEPSSDGSFAFAPAPGVGIWGRMIPVIEGGEIVDVVAWERDTPSAWWLLRRSVSLLGEHALRLALASGRPLILTSTPAKYLDFHAGRAACLLDWSTDLRLLFDGLTELRCDSPALERRVWQVVAEQARRPSFGVAGR